MKDETYIAWLPCEDRECYGLYEGPFVTSSGEQTEAYLKRLRKKAEAAPEEPGVWAIDVGTWYFGDEAVQRIDRELNQ